MSQSSKKRKKRAAAQQPVIVKATGFAAWQPWISLVLRVGLAGIALWSGIAKAQDLNQSAVATRSYDIFGWEMSQLIGTILPFAEIIIGLLLLAGLFIRWSALLWGLLMLAFIVGITQAWIRGLNIDCGCFGGGGKVEGAYALRYLGEILRDVGFALMAAFLMIFPRSRYSADHALDIEPENWTRWGKPARVEG